MSTTMMRDLRMYEVIQSTVRKSIFWEMTKVLCDTKTFFLMKKYSLGPKMEKVMAPEKARKIAKQAST